MTCKLRTRVEDYKADLILHVRASLHRLKHGLFSSTRSRNDDKNNIISLYLLYIYINETEIHFANSGSLLLPPTFCYLYPKRLKVVGDIVVE